MMLDKYVDAARVATSRARTVFLALAGVAGLFSVTYINLALGSNGRQLESLTRAEGYYLRTHGNLDSLDTARLGLRPGTPDRSPARTPRPLDEGQSEWNEFRSHLGSMADSTANATLHDELREMRMKQLTDWGQIEIPFLHASANVHDLWALVGLGLVFLQVILVYSMAREIRAVDLALTTARDAGDKRALRQTYDLLSMEQLFTVPPGTIPPLFRRRSDANPTGWWWSWPWRLTPRLLFLLPVVAQAFGTAVGVTSLADIISPGSRISALALFLVAIPLLIATFCLTGTCLVLETAYDRIWWRFHKVLTSGEHAANHGARP